MSKLRVQGGKLCVVAGQLEQCCQPVGVTCGDFGPDGPDCVILSLSGITHNPAARYEFGVQDGPVLCIHEGPVTVIAGANGSVLAERSQNPPVDGWVSTRAGFMALVVSDTSAGCSGAAQPPKVLSGTATVYHSVNLACRPSDDALVIVGVTAYLIDSAQNRPTSVPFLEADPIFIWSAPDLESGVGFGDAVPNQIADDVPVPLAVGGFAVVTLPDSCVPPPPEYAVARQCETGDPLVVDPAANVDALPGIRLNEEIYRLTSEVDPGPPVTVEWVDETCEDANSDRFRLCQRCPTGRRQGSYPEQVRCDINIPPGAGIVLYVISNDDGLCLIRYAATDQTTDDEGLTVGFLSSLPACASRDVCTDPGQPGDQPVDLNTLCDVCTGPAQPPVCLLPSVIAYLNSNCGRRLPAGRTTTSQPRPCLPCQQRRDAGLEAALNAQRRAVNCQGCGDAGLDGLL